MLKKGFLKPEISIEFIGKKKFWLGIVIGFTFSIIFGYFFNHSREALRFVTFSSDPYILSPADFIKYDLFFAFLSCSIGFGIVVVYWFLGSNHKIVKRYLKRYAITNAMLVAFATFMVVSRLGSILPIILFGRMGYDHQLNFHEDFRLLLILTPLYVFFSHWNAIRLFARTRHWIVISFLLYCLISLFVYKTTNVDKDRLNDQYFEEHKDRFNYIDQEINKAARLGVSFPENTEYILKKRFAPRTTELVLELKDAFASGRLLTIDTLILEKIFIHIMNEDGVFYNFFSNEMDKNWSYALPEHVYYQIKKHPVGSPEMKILFEILSEQVLLFTAEEIDWRYYESYSRYELERANFNRNILRTTETVLSRLVQVVEKLKEEDEYQQYHSILPDIEFNDHRGRQIYLDLDL